MPYRFSQHYTLDEARELLPKVRQWLQQLQSLQPIIEEYEDRVGTMLNGGQDCGGDTVNYWLRKLAEFQGIVHRFDRGDIQIKDLERGLIDFPHLMGDREVFLCWEQDEEDIQYWHDLNTGYAGREPI